MYEVYESPVRKETRFSTITAQRNYESVSETKFSTVTSQMF